MHKLIGIMLFILFALLGERAAGRLRQRQRLLERTALFLFSLKIETAYSCQPFPALLERLSLQSPDDTFLSAVDRLLKSGAPMHDAFAQAAGQTPGYLAEERARLCSLGAVLGTTDRDGQTELLSNALDWFRARETHCARQAKQYGVLFRSAGLFAGTAAFIVLL